MKLFLIKIFFFDVAIDLVDVNKINFFVKMNVNAKNVIDNAINVENIAIDVCDVVIDSFDAFDALSVEKSNYFDFFAYFVRTCSYNLILFENLTKQRLQTNFLININFSRCVFNQ